METTQKTEENQTKEEWFIIIWRLDNGYLIRGNDTSFVIEDDEKDGLKSHEKLLWEVMDYFNFGGTKHDPQRLRIVRKKE